MGRLRIAIAVNPGKARRLRFGKAGKGGGNAGVIVRPAPADPVCLPLVAQVQAAGGFIRRDFDEQGQVGQQALAADAVQVHDIGIGQAAAAALVGPAGIEETVSDYPFSCGQRRADQPFDMVGAGGGK